MSWGWGGVAIRMAFSPLPEGSEAWEDSLEKKMEIHSSILAWEIPWTEEPGGLWSIGLQRVRHD